MKVVITANLGKHSFMVEDNNPDKAVEAASLIRAKLFAQPERKHNRKPQVQRVKKVDTKPELQTGSAPYKVVGKEV